MRRLSTVLLFVVSCSDPGSLVLRIGANAHVRGPAETVKVKARGNGLDLLELELRRERRELMWPIELPIAADDGRIVVEIEVQPFPGTDGSSVAVFLETGVQAGLVREVDVDVSKSATIAVSAAELQPFSPIEREKDEGCDTPPPQPFEGWGTFVNLDRGRTCVAFVDRIGCTLELAEDCTFPDVRPTWRGGIRSDGSFYLANDDATIGCEGEIDPAEPRRARFECLPKQFGFRFARADVAQPFLREARRLRVDGLARGIDKDPRFDRAFVRTDRGFVVIDRSLDTSSSAPIENLRSVLDAGDALFTLEDGGISRRHPMTLEIEASNPRLTGVSQIFEGTVDGEIALVAITRGELHTLDRDSLDELALRIISDGAVEFVSESPDTHRLYFLSLEPYPVLLNDALESLPLPFEPLAWIGSGARAGFIAPCPDLLDSFCYLEMDLDAFTVVSVVPIETDPTEGAASYRGIAVLDAQRVAVYGAFGIHPVDRQTREPQLELGTDLALEDAAYIGGRLIGITSGFDGERVVVLEP